MLINIASNLASSSFSDLRDWLLVLGINHAVTLLVGSAFRDGLTKSTCRDIQIRDMVQLLSKLVRPIFGNLQFLG